MVGPTKCSFSALLSSRESSESFPWDCTQSFGINVAFIEEKVPVYIWKSSDHSHYWSIIYAGVDYTIVETILDRDSFPLKFYLKGIHTTSCMLLPWLKGQNTGWLLLSSTDLFPQDTWNIYVAFLSPPKSISHLEEIAKVRHRFQLQWTVPKSVRNEMVWRDTHYPVHSLPRGQSYFSVSVRTEFCPLHLQAR